MTIYLNRPVQFNKDLLFQWSAQNGETREKIALRVQDIKENAMSNVFSGRFMDISVNQGNGISAITFSAENLQFSPANNTKALGLFINQDCGYQVLDGPVDCEIWVASSLGGPKNSESRIGLYRLGTVIKVNTYANRKTPPVWRLEINGWKQLPEVNDYITTQEKLNV